MVFIDGKLQLVAARLVRNKRMNNSYQCPKFEKSEEMAARKSKWRRIKSQEGEGKLKGVLHAGQGWVADCWVTSAAAFQSGALKGAVWE